MRDARIVAAKLRGRTWPSIAAEHGLTARQAQRIFALWRDRQPGLEDLDSVVELEEVLAIQTQAIADLAELAEGDNVQDSVKVAAITRRVEIAERRFMGQRSFGGLRAEAEARELLDRFRRSFEMHRSLVPSPLADDLSALLRELDACRLTRTRGQEAARGIRRRAARMRESRGVRPWAAADRLRAPSRRARPSGVASVQPLSE